jgi:unsaturated rhamnogalacturonyl hydrolase
MYKKTIIGFLIAFQACNFQAQDQEKKADESKWSIRMANTILARSDSLIYYVDQNPKWAYDVAFLGMAIDRLGKINSRYSKYMEDWVNHFIKPDGSVKDYDLR